LRFFCTFFVCGRKATRSVARKSNGHIYIGLLDACGVRFSFLLLEKKN
jgi:hypothetical protein